MKPSASHMLFQWGTSTRSHTSEEVLHDLAQENRLAIPIQIHGCRIAEATRPTYGPATEYPDTDALITQEVRLALTIKTADCVPVLLYSEKAPHYIAAIHAGWRGTLQRIVSLTLQELKKRGVDTTHVLAMIGPCIRANAYEIDQDVAQHFDAKYLRKNRNTSKYHLDLAQANTDQLLECGVPSKNIFDTQACTYTQNDLYYSYRKEGPKADRLVSWIYKTA